jgi:hypothetical protein
MAMTIITTTPYLVLERKKKEKKEPSDAKTMVAI